MGRGDDMTMIKCSDEVCKARLVQLQSQVNRIKALCGELWEHMHPNSKDCDVCKALKQRLKDEGVNV